MSQFVASNIDPFRKGQSFENWVIRLEYHFVANKVKDEDRKSQLFLMGGDYLFQEVRLFYRTREALNEASYDEIVERLRTRLDKTESAFLQRYKFSTRVQEPGESATDFLLYLKIQSEYCNFGDQKDLNILDRLVAGLLDVNLKQRLLTEDSATFTLAQAEKIVTTWEIAAVHTKALSEGEALSRIAAKPINWWSRCGYTTV